MSIYEQLKYKVIGVEEDGSFSTGKAAVAGLIAGVARMPHVCSVSSCPRAGALGQLIASPTDLVKVQMQTQAVNGGVQYRVCALSAPPACHTLTRIQHVFHALTMLRREHGILGLWRGCVPNVQVRLDTGSFAMHLQYLMFMYYSVQL